MRRYLRFIPGIWLAAGLLAQAPAPFTMRSTQGPNVQLLSDGGTISFSSEGIGQSASASVLLTYTNRLGVTINSIDVIGSTDFTASLSAATLPIVLNFNDTTTFFIQYTPTALGKVTGTVRIAFTETNRLTTNLTVNLIGVQPDFGFSYQLTKGNQTSILPDGTIAFPDTTVNLSNPAQSQTSSATLVITNR